ncbi:MAG: 2-hydroxychromene-2-carboxylate isomerase [Betaproteobacteria bacterium]|nr:2-hydroxychromene-2-carboxylate isomerase [Betaproteobacteria bacterium]MCC6247876.1 2-hydroxychromene-2-carboxylate isomerase [Rubrivivax sp.]MCL4697407.1 2-hydroxychromene-2-carboxylate isomerase [Burkholderiaceae bacterium]
MDIAYYFTPVSPWTYLGHERFRAIARAADARVEVLPVDYGVIFPASGGLPLAKRAPQRQAYRLVELKRFSEWLKLPLNPQPKFFPVDAAPAARLVIAADRAAGPPAALTIAGAMMRAVWAEERNIAERETLAALLAENALAASLLAESDEPEIAARYEANTQRALAAGVFGAPSYVVDGENFWGQDRLDFLERRLRG